MKQSKTVQKILTERKLKGVQIKKFLLGKKVVPIINNQTGHTYPLHEPLVIDERISFNQYGMSGFPNPDGYGGGQIYFNELELLTNDLASVEQEIEFLQKDQARLVKDLDLAQRKLAFMKNTKVDVVDDKVFRAYLIETTLASEASNEDKAKLISDLLDS